MNKMYELNLYNVSVGYWDNEFEELDWQYYSEPLLLMSDRDGWISDTKAVIGLEDLGHNMPYESVDIMPDGFFVVQYADGINIEQDTAYSITEADSVKIAGSVALYNDDIGEIISITVNYTANLFAEMQYKGDILINQLPDQINEILFDQEIDDEFLIASTVTVLDGYKIKHFDLYDDDGEMIGRFFPHNDYHQMH